MARRELRTLEEVDRCVSSIDGADALLRNAFLSESERELVREWIDAPEYGGKLRGHEREHESLEHLIDLAKEVAEINSLRALQWAKFALWIAAISLLTG